VGIPMELAVGIVSDRVGRKKMYVAGAVAMLLYILPYLWMLNQNSIAMLIVATVVGFGVIWPMYGAVIGTLFAESYSPDVRYTGISLGYQIGAALVGGPAPLIATWLLRQYNGSYVPIGVFIMICGVISLVAVSFAKDKHGQNLDA